jgi:hypothetical protein
MWNKFNIYSVNKKTEETKEFLGWTHVEGKLSIQSSQY